MATVWEVEGLGLEARSLFPPGALGWVSCPGVVGLARQQLARGRAGRARKLVRDHGCAVLGPQRQARARGAQAAQAGRAHVAAEVHVQRLQRAPVRRHGSQRAVGDARAVLQAQRAQARAAAQQARQAVVGDVAAA